MRNFEVHVESARMKNFLSFYEGTIEFDSGLTVIVGPNGSGKTSIFHAIKFALGSNQRENRYSKWSDFIRHGASSAEVEITVKKNGQKIGFLRKIDRDGIPRSYVDGKRAKAAELRAIVDGLNLDMDNPLVFMPQERINALRDMDPVEVRKLVEEGTGLDTLRDRITLQQTRVAQSRERLETATAESIVIERELELLKYDLDRLTRKRSLQKQEEELDGEVKWATIDSLMDEVERVKLEIESFELGLGKVLEDSSSLSEQIEKEETGSAELQKRLEGIQKETGRIDARIEEEERRLLRLEDDTKKMVSEIRQLEREITKDKRTRDKMREDIKRASASKEKFMEKQRILHATLEETEEDRDRIEDELAAFASWNTRRAEAFGTYKALQADVKGKDLLIRSLREKLQTDEADLQSIETKWGHVWSVLEDADERELVRRKSQLEREIATLNEQRFTQASLAAQLEKQIDELKVRLSETSKRIPDAVKELKDGIRERKLESVVGPLVEMIEGQDDLSTAIEAILPLDMAFAFIVKDKADYSLVQKIRNKTKASSPIILPRKNVTAETRPDLPEWKGIRGWFWETLPVDIETRDSLREAFGDYVLASDSATAERVVSKLGFNAISLDGYSVVIDDKRILSHPKRDPSGIMTTAPLQKRLEQSERELNVVRKQVTDVMLDLETKTNDREQVMDLIGQVTRWSGTWERRKKLLKAIPEFEERIVSLDDELKKLQADFGKAERDLRNLDNTQPPERSRLVGQKSAIIMKQKRFQSELAKVESNINASERDTDLQRSELKRLDESLNMLSNRLEELKTEIKDSKSSASSIMESIELLKEGRIETEKKYETTKKEQQQISANLRSMSERLVELNLQVRSNRLQVMQSKRQLDNMEHEQKAITEELMSLVRPDNVRQLDVARDDLIRVRHLLDDYQDVSESVAHTEIKLKDRILQLAGKISELQEELNEAESTVKDIREQYHNGMNETLGRVESEVNNILNTVQFQGRVRFELAMRHHDYGVEFKTKIRGEDFTKLSAGSGGERSLIAIGLILALQRFNPAPVYAMDEIDTFLDATNTEMVSRLLHDSSRKSQFILFTPAKSTHLLRHADKRLGVVSPSGVEPSIIIESPSFSSQ
ncbi:MAG: AAA family ATPase [Candidatus Thorarchaeota archaeon]